MNKTDEKVLNDAENELRVKGGLTGDTGNKLLNIAKRVKHERFI